MRVLMLEAPTALLEQRARLGHDRWDEMWEGILHMVPAPRSRHQEIVAWLAELLRPLARTRGLIAHHEVNLHRPGRDDDYRIPDFAVWDVAVASERGVEGAALTVVEVRSPEDESYEKIPWYLEVGVGEVVIVDRDTLTVEVFRSLDPSTGEPVLADDTTITSLDVTLGRVSDDHLQIDLHDGSVRDITL